MKQFYCLKLLAYLNSKYYVEHMLNRTNVQNAFSVLDEWSCKALRKFTDGTSYSMKVVFAVMEISNLSYNIQKKIFPKQCIKAFHTILISKCYCEHCVFHHLWMYICISQKASFNSISRKFLGKRMMSHLGAVAALDFVRYILIYATLHMARKLIYHRGFVLMLFTLYARSASETFNMCYQFDAYSKFRYKWRTLLK